MFLEFIAGAALGLLLGTLVGFSSSPVVATVVGALAGAMLVLLGFTSKLNPDGDLAASSRSAAGRLAGFGSACTLALVCALYVRTHDGLSTPVKTQIVQLTDAGFTPDEAHAWVAYRNVGLLLRLKPEAVGNKENKAGGSGSSVLFSSTGTDECALFDVDRYANSTEHLAALRNTGGRFGAFAQSITALDEPSRALVLRSTKQLFCP